MSSIKHPNILAFLADGAIAKGKAVKIGSDNKHVVVCAGATDKSIGIAWGSASAAEDTIEVCLHGGGAKGLAQTTIAAGKLVVSHTDGALKPIAASGDRVIGVAMEDAVAGDLFAMDVVISQAVAAE